MLDALGEALGEIEPDRAVRAVILTGAGRAFSAGADIKEWTALRRSSSGAAGACAAMPCSIGLRRCRRR